MRYWRRRVRLWARVEKAKIRVLSSRPIFVSQATWKKTTTPLTPRLVRLLREAALYLLAAIGAYLLISLWTYHPFDPSWSHRGASTAVANVGGRVGAWLSDVLFGLFGYVAFLFPVLIAIGGWRIYLHRNDAEPATWKHRAIVSGAFLLVLIGGGGLANLHYVTHDVPFTAGGWLGNGIGTAFVAAFGFTGATLLLLAIFLSGVTLYTGLSWLRLMDATGRASFALLSWLKQLLSITYDRVIGLRARKQRRETIT